MTPLSAWRKTRRSTPQSYELKPRILRGFHGASGTRTRALLGAIQTLAAYESSCSDARGDAAFIAPGWRTEWRTTTRIPANRHFRNGLETVRDGFVPRGFESLPLRFAEKPHGMAVSRAVCNQDRLRS
jgi:hypothetical protein